jgi:hypothetical protein
MLNDIIWLCNSLKLLLKVNYFEKKICIFRFQIIYVNNIIIFLLMKELSDAPCNPQMKYKKLELCITHLQGDSINSFYIQESNWF